MSDGGYFCEDSDAEDSDEFVCPYDGLTKIIDDANSQITRSTGMLPPPDPSGFEPMRTDRVGRANMGSGLMPRLYIGMLLQAGVTNTAEIKRCQQECN